MAVQERAPEPRIGRKRMEAGSVLRHLDVLDLIDRPLHGWPPLLRLFRDRREVVDDPRFVVAQRLADAYAQKPWIVVHPVGARRLAALPQERLDLRTRDAEERADDAVVADGMN